MVRNRFETELNDLHLELTRMGALAEQVIEDTMLALDTLDSALADKVMEEDDHVDSMARHIESKALKIIMRQQPVARDLRSVSAALKMITDIERICDQAADIAEIIKMLNKRGDGVCLATINDMGRVAINMVRLAVDSFVKDSIDTAERVIKMDDDQDSLFNQAKEELLALALEDRDQIDLVIDCLMIAKYLERISDHAENIADWTTFVVTGMHKNEQII
jgi:phosphate transport system protein